MGGVLSMQKLGASTGRLVLALLLAMLLNGCAKSDVPPEAVGGRIDLASWDFGSHGPARLDGQWEFYPQRLAGPDDLAELRRPEKTFIPLPGLWETDPQGFATYRLFIDNYPDRGSTSLFITDVLSVGRIWINGRLSASSGEVGPESSAELPRAHSIHARFEHMGGPLEVVLQVSNFNNLQGGVNTPVWIGPERMVQHMTQRMWTVSAVLGGVLLIMGLLHVFIFALRRKGAANLYLGLFCIMWATQNLFGVNGGCLMATLFPALPWRLSIDLTLLSYGLITPLMVMFYHALFPNARSHIINRFYQVIAGLFIAYLLLTPPNAYDPVVFFYTLATLSAVVYLFGMFVHDLVKKRRKVLLLVPGYAILAFTAANDVLYDMHLIETAGLIPYGVLAFIMSYSLVISARTSRAFSMVDKLTTELEYKEQVLSSIIPAKDNGQAKRQKAVEVMNEACSLWSAYTKTSKAELADRSGLWNVYIDQDGWARTQTLDKYLDIETLPAKPRWKVIQATADFVLSECEGPAHLRSCLEKTLAEFSSV
mgnify:CR=1 FL=1